MQTTWASKTIIIRIKLAILRYFRGASSQYHHDVLNAEITLPLELFGFPMSKTKNLPSFIRGLSKCMLQPKIDPKRLNFIYWVKKWSFFEFQGPLTPTLDKIFEVSNIFFMSLHHNKLNNLVRLSVYFGLKMSIFLKNGL